MTETEQTNANAPSVTFTMPALQLKRIIKALVNVNPAECTLAKQNGDLVFAAMDDQRVALLSITIPGNSSIARETQVDLKTLEGVVARTYKSDSITLSCHDGIDGKNSFDVHNPDYTWKITAEGWATKIEGDGLVTTRQKLHDSVFKSYYEFDVDRLKFQRLLLAAARVTEHLELVINDGHLAIGGRSDNGQFISKLPISNLVTHGHPPIMLVSDIGLFSCDYVKRAAEVPQVKHLTFKVSSTAPISPITISGESGAGFSYEIYFGPKIEDDEEDDGWDDFEDDDDE